MTVSSPRTAERPEARVGFATSLHEGVLAAAARSQDDGDLLDRRECAALIGVAPDSWKTYKNDPVLVEARIEAGGGEYWPRWPGRAVTAR